MNILAIIPARAGSKRLPGKNTAIVAGAPLITHTIRAAKQSAYINKIVVSTNDPQVEQAAAAEKTQIIKRPETLATDTSRTEDALIHATQELEKQGYTPDIIVLLQPTSPLRSVEDIDNTIRAITSKGADSAQTVSEASEHPSLMVTLDKEGRIEPLDKEDHLKRSQELKKVYLKNGSVYACKYKVLKEQGSIYGKKHLGIITPKERSIDIDLPKDLELARQQLEKK